MSEDVGSENSHSHPSPTDWGRSLNMELPCFKTTQTYVIYAESSPWDQAKALSCLASALPLCYLSFLHSLISHRNTSLVNTNTWTGQGLLLGNLTIKPILSWYALLFFAPLPFTLPPFPCWSMEEIPGSSAAIWPPWGNKYRVKGPHN